MWAYLIGALVTLGLPALGFGLTSESVLNSSFWTSLGPAMHSNSEISKTKLNMGPKKYIDDTIPPSSGNISVFGITVPKTIVDNEHPVSGTAPETITVSGRTVRDTIERGKGSEQFNRNNTLSSLKTLSSNAFNSSYVINKCCPHGEYLFDVNLCVPLKETKNLSDPWWWIAPSQRQNLALETLTDSQVSYKWKSCSKNMRVFVGFDNFNVTLHRRKDGVSLESVVDNKDLETTYEFAHESFCLDVGKSGEHLAILCPCTELICLRKCCSFNYEFDAKLSKCTKADEDHFDWVPAFDDDWKTDQKHITLNGRPRCGPHEEAFAVHDMKSNLDLIMMGNGSIKSNVTGAIYHRDTFCADLTTTGHETVIICKTSATSEEMATSFAIGVLLAIGSVALLLTVCISLALPETRKRLHGRMSLMHNTMLLVAYVSTGVLHFITLRHNMSIAASKVISFVIQFSFLSAFFWLNVMCIDIAMVFRGWRLVQGNAIQQEEKKFFYYSVYAWGSVFLISVATAIAEFVPGARPRPAFGESRHFFSNDVAMLLFFYGPMAILLVANVILFIFTAIKIKTAAQESRMVLNCADSRTSSKNKFRLAVYAKLSTLMGVTWIFEVLSWAIGGDPRVWFLLDAVNLLRAVFIFIIFCCNKHVYRQLKQRAETLFSRGSSRVSVNNKSPSSSTLAGNGHGMKSSEKLVNSAKVKGGKLEESKKSSRCNLRDFVKPSCQRVVESAQQPWLKDTQL